MKDIEKKISYLKGLADGLKIAEKDNEGKVMIQIIDILDEMAQKMADLEYGLSETDYVVDELDESLAALADDVYADFDDDDDMDFDDDDDDDFGDFDDDEFYDDFDDDSELFELECPNCGEDVMIDFDMLDDGNSIVCPNCHEEIELEIEYDCDCGDEDCDCGHDED